MKDSPRHRAQSPRHFGSRSPRVMTAVASLSVAALALAGCTNAASAQSVVNTEISTETATFFNADSVHEISVTAEPDDITAALKAYAADGTKDWISADITIDGTTFKNVGMKLKGNSTLRGADESSDAATLPWILRLDKFEANQSYSGRTEFVIRTNSSESSLNEAVALDLLGEAGLATEHAAATRFSLNGSDAELRLVIDNPSDELYSDETFEGDGITYKADADGDYSYRGDAASDYESAFEVESGADDLTPVATFLDFVNNSSDEDFSSKLSDYLDTDQFATYLAMQDLVSNTDDIDGPGNNSFLRYDNETKKMTVVAWDQNLSFGSGPGGMGGGGAMGGGNGGGPGKMDADSLLTSMLPDGLKLADAKKQIEAGTVPDGMELPEQMTLQDGTKLIDVLKDLVNGEMPDGLSFEGRGGQPPAMDGQGGQPPAMDGQGGAPGGNMTPPDQNSDEDSNATESKDTADDTTDAAKDRAEGGQNGGKSMGGKSNPLVTRFLADEDFKAQYEAAKTELADKLYESGTAEEILNKWTTLLNNEASDLIDSETVSSEADTIRSHFTSDSVQSSTPNNQQPSTAPKTEEDEASPSASPTTSS
ncbi:CotH kinase family protein [Glutamicibacter sp. JL.03c]|uniref:CotH kinase family protein n=1 Tax=Glutamicibacter sp. JL.03c TaxID=2984842 RepID=UPI0021F75385|nr:CotH kinase family protein [Glutamicibacter sp. JL.03c]UYQ78715.1 CotH kinase family protein [Glutamicibacter sp. JL.03c]